MSPTNDDDDGLGTRSLGGDFLTRRPSLHTSAIEPVIAERRRHRRVNVIPLGQVEEVIMYRRMYNPANVRKSTATCSHLHTLYIYNESPPNINISECRSRHEESHLPVYEKDLSLSTIPAPRQSHARSPACGRTPERAARSCPASPLNIEDRQCDDE